MAFFGLALHASYSLLAAYARAGLVTRHPRLSASMRQLDTEYHALVAPEDDGRGFPTLASLLATATPPPTDIVGHAARYADFPSRLAKLGAEGQNDDGTQREGDPAAARLAGNLVAALEEAEDMDKIVERRLIRGFRRVAKHLEDEYGMKFQYDRQGFPTVPCHARSDSTSRRTSSSARLKSVSPHRFA